MPDEGRCSGLGLTVGKNWQCFDDILFSGDRHNARSGEKRLALNLVALDHYYPTLLAVYLAIDNHAVFQDGKFCGPIVWAPVQETVVMLGSHFDQDLQREKPRLRAQQINGRDQVGLLVARQRHSNLCIRRAEHAMTRRLQQEDRQPHVGGIVLDD